MPVFTAIGAYVATSLFGLAAGTLAAAVVGGIVAVGAAMLTSRLINGGSGGGGDSAAAAQGTRVQLQPSLENKIPVLFGTAYCNGTVIDAYLDNENNYMTYVMVISETCNVTGATYSVQSNANGPEIYWNDLRLNFDGSNQSRAIAGKKVVDSTNGTEDFTDTNFADKVFINIYAGNSATKIWGNKTLAKDAVNQFVKSPEPLHWTSGSGTSQDMEGLVFAVISVKYNSEQGFTGLPQMTFKLRNSIDNPADVLLDYMQSDRYGANISGSDIDTSSFSTYATFCSTVLSYTDINGNSTTGKRYTINGLIDTSRTSKDNIETILLNSSAWMSFDVAQGKWRVIPKHAITGTTWSQAYEKGTPTNPTIATNLRYSDDNIVSGISISSTRLDNLYNKANVDFYDTLAKDQRGYVNVNLPSRFLNYNEPDNSINLQLDLTNNSVQAERIANIELKQSRDDLVITFTTSHFGLQAQAGDVVAVYNDLYGWNSANGWPYGKLFRVLKTREAEVNGGSLVNEISALEYNADVYSNEPITEFTTSNNIGINPREGTGNILAPLDDYVSIFQINANDAVPNIIISVTVPSTGGPYDEIQVWAAEDTIGSSPALSAYEYIMSHNPPPPAPTYEVGSVHLITITQLPANAAGKEWFIRVRMGVGGLYSEYTDPDLATIPEKTIFPYDPDAGASSAAVLNIKKALLRIDFGNIVIPNNGLWALRTFQQADFGLVTDPENLQLDLGLVSVTENTPTAATDLESFVWQVDPT